MPSKALTPPVPPEPPYPRPPGGGGPVGAAVAGAATRGGRGGRESAAVGPAEPVGSGGGWSELGYRHTQRPPPLKKLRLLCSLL